jgi:hypothetical protein
MNEMKRIALLYTEKRKEERLGGSRLFYLSLCEGLAQKKGKTEVFTPFSYPHVGGATSSFFSTAAYSSM